MKVSYRRLSFFVSPATLHRLARRMRFVRAAGGVVSDDEGNRLLIFRNSRWDLPKGKVEPGESLLQAALREVQEETGLATSLSPSSPRHAAVKTYHVYNLYGGWHLKQTSWFPLHVSGIRPTPTPQQEEGISAAVWVSPSEWRHRLLHSYGTLKTIASLWNC